MKSFARIIGAASVFAIGACAMSTDELRIEAEEALNGPQTLLADSGGGGVGGESGTGGDGATSGTGGNGIGVCGCNISMFDWPRVSPMPALCERGASSWLNCTTYVDATARQCRRYPFDVDGLEIAQAYCRQFEQDNPPTSVGTNCHITSCSWGRPLEEGEIQ